MQDDKQRIEFAKWLLERSLGWIATADGKVTAAVAIYTAMLGGLAAAYGAADAGAKTAWALLFVWSASAGLVLATFFAALAAVPRMLGPVRSMIFFGRVAEQPLPEYLDFFGKVTEKELLEDLVTQVHRNSQIARVKHQWVRKSLICSFLAALPWSAGIALLVRG